MSGRPSPENAWHFYDDDLNLRAILHRAGFVPAGRFGDAASSFGEYLVYRRADPAGALDPLASFLSRGCGPAHQPGLPARLGYPAGQPERFGA